MLSSQLQVESPDLNPEEGLEEVEAVEVRYELDLLAEIQGQMDTLVLIMMGQFHWLRAKNTTQLHLVKRMHFLEFNDWPKIISTSLREEITHLSVMMALLTPEMVDLVIGNIRKWDHREL